MEFDPNELVNTIKTLTATPENEIVDLIAGQVTSLSPIAIRVESMTVTSDFITLSPLCIGKSVSFQLPSHSHSVSGGSSDITIPASETGENEEEPIHTHPIPANTTSVTMEGSETGEYTFPPVTLTLWRGLQVGDNVLMLKCGKGQKYYVLQRVGNL